MHSILVGFTQRATLDPDLNEIHVLSVWLAFRCHFFFSKVEVQFISYIAFQSKKIYAIQKYK